MLDIKFIRDNSDLVKNAIKLKGVELDLDELLKLDDKRREHIVEVDELRAERNKVSADIPNLEGEEKQKQIEAMRKVGDRIKEIDAELNPLLEEFNTLMLKVPNIPSEDSPIGGEEANQEIARHGDLPNFDFEPKDHVALMTERGFLDLDRGAKTSGYRGYYLKGEMAQLHLAIMMFGLNKLAENDFTAMIPPTLVRDFALLGSGHFPSGKDEIYQIGNPGKLADGSSAKEPLFLAGTSEPSLLAYFAEKTFEEDELPIKVGGMSACYRSEIGSYGKDTKGLYRVHEFWKIEQVVLCKADTKESDEWLEKLRGIAESILQDLELPYRVLQLATGDMGDGKRKMYDLEAWMPSRDSYGETHSDSNLTDWQTRRLNIRYKDKEGHIHFAHGLNNTAVASPRILIALIENHQQADGSIKIPKALQSFMGGKESF